MPLSAYDWLLARRTFLLSVALGGLVFAVRWAPTTRRARTQGGQGASAGFRVLAAERGVHRIEQARSRGEMRAIGAAGVRPAKAALGAVLGERRLVRSDRP